MKTSNSNIASSSNVVITILDNAGNVFDSCEWLCMEDLNVMLQNVADEPACMGGKVIISADSLIDEVHEITDVYLKEMGIA
ncbi:hypothetical protein NBH15_03670 [Parabacteroides sp. W1-Q-101]|uniref:hypothetical protein n=1 Tax=Parabacteroides caeci TaxID=2949650 RepID=UPI00202E52D1|nr:hypothetical protein [Parabacteroides sp. W1-Q-101]MCM0717369.1 hypothetical protein [Parabacteroides sp. W1-Q-101]